MSRHRPTSKAPLLAALILASAWSPSALAFDDFEGSYVNGDTTITWRAGGRSGNEFLSSRCPGKKFRHRTQPGDAHKGKDYTVQSDFGFTKLVVTGSSKCLPRGTYQREG
ncbi:hypothetical protein [Variovorax saccharolyticus]|uniref:hypothetical protein n=1 Tax=Variovorax saccharolyticus TaxID=3053516 RepID=UPI00257764B3|nr:hypothetical protein [Variovorax sp. J31P216]MDM0027410.1 hypothetical protein [Variovorax sp. J31P216]